MNRPSALELYKTETDKLRDLAGKLGIHIPNGATRFDIIDLIRLFPTGPGSVGDITEEQAQKLLEKYEKRRTKESWNEQNEVSSETAPEIQKFSVRIQRIRDANR